MPSADQPLKGFAPLLAAVAIVSMATATLRLKLETWPKTRQTPMPLAVDAAIAAAGPFDEAFATGVEDEMWAYAEPATNFTNAFLQPPPDHLLALLVAASNDRRVADRVVGFFTTRSRRGRSCLIRRRRWRSSRAKPHPEALSLGGDVPCRPRSLLHRGRLRKPRARTRSRSSRARFRSPAASRRGHVQRAIRRASWRRKQPVSAS